MGSVFQRPETGNWAERSASKARAVARENRAALLRSVVTLPIESACRSDAAFRIDVPLRPDVALRLAFARRRLARRALRPALVRIDAPGAPQSSTKAIRGRMTEKERRASDAAIPDNEERLVLAIGRYIGEGFEDARMDVRTFDYVDRKVPMLLMPKSP